MKIDMNFMHYQVTSTRYFLRRWYDGGGKNWIL